MSRFPMLSRLAGAAGVLLKGLGVDPAMWLRGADLNMTLGGADLVNPYANSVWVSRAIKKVAGPIAAVELEFTDGEKEIEDPALKAFWEYPAVGLCLADFIEASVTWLKLKGESFWILDDAAIMPYPDLATKGPQKMIVARPDRMRHICGQDGELIGWEFTDKRGRRWPLLPEQVIQTKYLNPYNDYRGLSEYDAARIAAEGDFASGKFVRNLAQSNGDQGVIVAAKGGMPSDEQREQITQQLRMKRRMQQNGQFVPVFLTGDVSIEDPKIRAPDGDFWNGRLQSRHEIFLAFGVPPSMADKMESYSIGSASDWFILIFETCIPTGIKVAGAIDQANAKLFGAAGGDARAPIKAEFDWDEHPVMQEVRRERLKLADGLWDKGMPMESINDYLSLGMKPFAGWEAGYLPFSVAPVSSGAPAPEKEPAFNEPDETGEPKETYQEMLRALRGPAELPQNDPLQGLPKCFENCCNHARTKDEDEDEDESTKTERPAHEVKHWVSLMVKRMPTIRAFEAKINKSLFDARAEVLRNVAKHHNKGGWVEKAGAVADMLFDLGDFTAKLISSMRGVAIAGLQSAGEQLFEEVGKDDPFKMAPQEVLSFWSERQNKLSNLPQEIFDRTRDTLQEGVDNGDTIAELSARVRAEFNDMSEKRATTIAMTETAAAYGTGRHKAMRLAGIAHKKWLTSGNVNVRAAHRLMNGISITIDEAFTVLNPKTGETDSIMHPGDPDGEPWNVINCHCVELASAK